jgi:hypothetical protein
MFFTALKDGKNWGAGASGSPVVSSPYWFLSSKEPSQAKGLPPILVFAVEVAKWSDGTAAPMHWYNAKRKLFYKVGAPSECYVGSKKCQSAV